MKSNLDMVAVAMHVNVVHVRNARGNAANEFCETNPKIPPGDPKNADLPPKTNPTKPTSDCECFNRWVKSDADGWHPKTAGGNTIEHVSQGDDLPYPV